MCEEKTFEVILHQEVKSKDFKQSARLEYGLKLPFVPTGDLLLNPQDTVRVTNTLWDDKLRLFIVSAETHLVDEMSDDDFTHHIQTRTKRGWVVLNGRLENKDLDPILEFNIQAS